MLVHLSKTILTCTETSEKTVEPLVLGHDHRKIVPHNSKRPLEMSICGPEYFAVPTQTEQINLVSSLITGRIFHGI